MDMSPELRELLTHQSGIASCAQLKAGRVTPEQIRWQVGRRWRVVLPGVLLLSPQLPTDHQRRVAALVYAGPSAWLSGRTAAALHGLVEERPGSRIHVLVPAPQNPRDVAWVSIRRTHVVNERIVERGPLRFSCRARAVVDTAAESSVEDARALIIEAVQRRLVRLDDVAHWVEARRPNGRRVLRLAVVEAAAGAWSLPEADLAALVRRSRVLPQAWANPELRDLSGTRLTTPDLWLDDVGMAVMVHSRKFHADSLDWDATVDSDGDLSAARVVVVGVTPASLARDPEAVLRRIENAYLTARRSGQRAPVIAVPREPHRRASSQVTSQVTSRSVG